MDPGVEPGHDLARLDVPEVAQVAPVQPLEEQRAAARVGTQQPHHAVAVPVLEGQGFVRGLVVAVEAHLEDGRLALRRSGPAPPASRSRARGRRRHVQLPLVEQGRRTVEAARRARRPSRGRDRAASPGRPAARSSRGPSWHGSRGDDGGQRPDRRARGGRRWGRRDVALRAALGDVEPLEGVSAASEGLERVERGAAQSQRTVQMGRVHEPGGASVVACGATAGRYAGAPRRRRR